MSNRVAIVTGANRGLGFETAKKLCEAGIETIITSRNRANGEEAVLKLNRISNKVKMMELDVSNAESRHQFVEAISSKYDHIDILVNNAGIYIDNDRNLPFKEQAKRTVATNYFAVRELTEMLLPLLLKGNQPRIVNVSSELGHLTCINDNKIRNEFTSEKLTTEQLNEIMCDYIQDVELDQVQSKGWPSTSYALSKCAVIALTKILSRQPENKGVLINCCCPGYCKTDMNKGRGNKTPEEGARTIAMLALLPKNSNINGKFFADEEEIDW